MRKSFTRLLSLVMLFALLSSVVMAATGINYTTIWPQDPSGGKAWTKTTDKIMVIYSEAVKAGSGYVRLYENGSLSRSILATDSRISYAKGDTVVIDFSVDQKELKTYTVSIDEGTFKTVAASTPCSAIATSAWAYTVGDYTAPTLKSVDPVKGSIVDQTISLAMTFDDASSILKGDAGKIAVYKADGNVWDLIDLAHIGTHSATVSGSVLTVSGIRGLEDLTNYAVTIGAGVVTDDGSRADHEKNAFTGLTDRTVWTFTSKDFSAPGFADGYPKIGTVGVDSFDLLVKTTEAGKFYAVAETTTSTVDASLLSTLTATTAVSLTSGVEAKMTFSAKSKNTKYYVYVVTENADKAPTVAAINGPIEVTTIDSDKPVLGFVKYFKGTTAGGTATVTTNTVANALIDQKTDKIVFDFDGTTDKISVGSGSVVIYKKTDNTVYTTIDAANISIDTNGNAVATISKAFENAANYYAFIPSTLFKDQYNNFYGGITTTTGWTFSTNDIVAPSIVSYTPAQGESGVAIDKNIVVKFSEVMDIPASGSTSATYFTLEVDGSTASYTFTHSTNNNAFSTVTISPTVTYASSAVVTLTVNGNIADASANHNKLGLTQGVSFVVKDIVGPKINTAKTKTPLAPADPIVFVFNEPVYLLGGTPITASNLYTLVTLKETDENGLNVAASYAISEDKTTITITPSSPLSSGKTYYVAISSDVQDIAGNKCIDDKADRSKSFTINDVTPATVSIDKDGKTDVSVSGTITISFKNENNIADPIGKLYYGGDWVDYSLAGMNNVIVFKKGDANGANVAFSVASTNSATFVVTPDADLDGPSTYYIGVGASTKDGADNVSAAKYASFSTVYAGAPKDFVLSPTDGQTEVALKAPVTIAFNTDISLIGSASYTGTEVTIFNVTTNTSTTITYDKLSVSGKTLTIAHSDFVKNTDYYILIPAGVVLNKASNVAFGGITASTTWNFTSVDQRFEAFTLDPDNVSNVKLDAKLKIIVPEKVIAGTGNISIKNWDTDYLIEQIPSTSSQVAITYDSNTSTIAITPSAKFVYGGKYYVEVDNGAFTDTHANKIPAIVGKTESSTTTNWTFKAVDPDLAVSKVTPTGEHVTNSTDIVVTFNREIKKGTTGQVGFSEYAFTGGAAKQDVRYGITSSNLIVSGNTLTIQHADKLFSNDSKVYLYIDANAIQSTTVTPTTVNVVGTYSTSTSEGYYFYVGDNLAPEATVSPVWDDKKIYSPVNTNITITFNEDVINKDTGLALTTDNVSAAGGIIQLLVGGATTTVDFTGTVSGRTITIDPTSDLAQSSTYSVTIVTGTIADAYAHVIGDFTSIFKTTDTTLPVVVEATATPTVSSGIHQIAATVKITELNPNKIYYVLKKKTDAAPTVVEVKAGKNKLYTSDTNVALDVFSNLEASTEYVLYYVADDTFGNITTLQTKEVKTVDTVAPLLVSTDPVNGTVNVDNAKKITFTFNEAVQIGTGSVYIYIKDKATNSVISTIGTASMTVVANSSEKKVELTTGFSATMAPVEVYIEMDKGAIQDKATTGANDFAGIFGSDKVYFTYEDNTAPTLSKFTAPVALNSNIVLTFSENVQAGSGSAILYTGTGTSTTTAIEVFKGNEVAISGNTVTLNPTLNFDNSQPYTLDIAVGFVRDLSSNKNNNVASTVTFTTTEDVAPSVATVTPTEFTDHNKSELETIELKFSENVYLTIAGLNKSLIVLTEADIKSKISFTKADGTAVPFTVADKQSDYVKLSVTSDDLAHLTSYILTVSGFKDIDGLVMATETFNYTTGDGKAPVITFNPAKDAKNVIGTNALTLTFSEAIYHGVTSDGLFYQPFTNDNVDEIVYLYDTTLGATVSSDATFNGTNVITLTPQKALVSGHVYQYGLDPVKGIVSDIKGNTLLGSTSATRVSFTVLDTEKPTFALETGKVSPAPSATKVIADEKMWIAFNEDVLVGTGNITIRYEDGTIFQTISGASLSISAKVGEGNILLVAHKNFDSDATYFVEVGEGVVTDKAGNKNVAMTDPTKWTFTTKDTFDLTATVTPLGTGTPRTVSLTLSFNKVPSVLVDNKFLAVYKADGTAVYQKAVNTMTVIGKDAIYSGVELEANQAYYARVEAGAFEDASGNSFAGIMDSSWAFSTVDNIAPKVVTLTPADNATGVDAQTSAFTMTFDRNIAVGTGLISVRYTIGGGLFDEVNVTSAVVNGMTLTFNVSKPLEAQSAYYVIVPAGAITNTVVTKDPFAGILNTYTWNFTTSTDLTAPTATYSPNGTTAADNHPSLQMTFNEDVTVATGNVKIYKASDNVLTVTIPVTAAMLSGKTVSLTYAGGLDKNTDYYVLVDGGVVKDLAANAFAGVTATTTWTFKTGADFATPVVPVINDSQFKVYPNPFVDYVTVENASELSKVVVSNIAGQIVKEVVRPDNTIQLNELRSGVYFISLYQDGAVIKTVKLIKR